MTISAGELTQRLALQSDAGTTIDAYGQAIRSWTTYATVWASVRPLSGREQEIGAARGTVVSHRVKLRYRSDIVPGHRFLLGSRVIEIVSVRNWDEKGVSLEIDAVERST